MVGRGLMMAALAAAPLLAVVPSADAALIASYTFNESSGTTASPSVGSVTGTLTGSASFVPGGVQGGAVNIASSGGGFVDFGTSLGPSGPFSVQVWVNTTANVSAPVSFHYASIAAGFLIGIGDINDGCGVAAGRMSFYVAYPCSGGSTTAVNDGNWHQLVGVYDGSKSYVYVDGTLESQSVGGNPLNAPPGGTPFLAGGINTSGGLVSSYDGLLDNLQIYNAALTANEVGALYQATLSEIPEPASLLLFAGAAGALGAVRRRQRP